VTGATGQFPDLLGSRRAGQLCGVSQGTFNDWVRRGLVPQVSVHPVSFGGWPRYSTVQLRRWLAGELTEAAS
jgi:hypothetical protein